MVRLFFLLPKLKPKTKSKTKSKNENLILDPEKYTTGFSHMDLFILVYHCMFLTQLWVVYNIGLLKSDNQNWQNQLSLYIKYEDAIIFA